MSLPDQHREALASVWKQFIDRNDKGIIDFDEWNDSIKRLNISLTDNEIKNIFKLIDQKDGGNIDQLDFVQTIINNHNNNNTNNELTKLLNSLSNYLPNLSKNNNNNSISKNNPNDDDNKQKNEKVLLAEAYNKYFGSLNKVNEDLWIQKISKLNLSINEDDLRLFHACLDSQFRSSFDKDEFIETFTINTLNHSKMDQIRDQIKTKLLPKPKPKPKPVIAKQKPAVAKPVATKPKLMAAITKSKVRPKVAVKTAKPVVTTKPKPKIVITKPKPQPKVAVTAKPVVKTIKKATKEISIQTMPIDYQAIVKYKNRILQEMKRQQQIQIKQQDKDDVKDDDMKDIDDNNGGNDDNDDDNSIAAYDDEIDALQEHIISEEKYLKIMDEIDLRKKRNIKLFKYENALLWSVYEVISWLHDINIKDAKIINKFKEKLINGNILLNDTKFNKNIMINEFGLNEIDSAIIERCILLLKNIPSSIMTKEEMKQKNNDHLKFYKQKCLYLNRELQRMGKIETMFKRNRRETEAKLKQLECNLYYGSLSSAHLINNFDISQLFKMQQAYNKSLLNIQDVIQIKVQNMMQNNDK